MKVLVKTESNSTYLLDQEKMTWLRTDSPVLESAYPLRTPGGSLNEWPEIKIGQGIRILGPPINPLATFRLVYTANVVSVEYL